ncbi:hypothetical protein NPIL_568201, partial [Nephila pilipes]
MEERENHREKKESEHKVTTLKNGGGEGELRKNSDFLTAGLFDRFELGEVALIRRITETDLALSAGRFSKCVRIKQFIEL